MSDKATFLQGLLERVKRNAARPRAPRAGAMPTAVSVSEALPEPVAAPQPPVAAPPAPVALPAAKQRKAEESTTYHVTATPPVTEMVVEELDASVEVMELDEAEIVDITLEEDEPAAPVAAAKVPDLVAAKPPEPLATDIDFDDEERAPASSRRPILAASSLDEALAGAADEHEVPIKTPPPESGPQEALPPAQVLQQKPLELDEPGMEAELARSGPAPEQVGNTIELEEPAGPALELDSLPAESGPQLGRGAEELEAELKLAKSDRAPDVAARPTPAIEKGPESEAPELTSAVVPVSAPIPAPPEPRVDQLIPPATARVVPEITPRSLPPNDVPLAAFARAHREFRPATFIELLDASLKLGG